jgi:hypothetical protein
VSVPNFLTKATRQTIIAVMVVATACWLAATDRIGGEAFVGIVLIVVAADFKKP